MPRRDNAAAAASPPIPPPITIALLIPMLPSLSCQLSYTKAPGSHRDAFIIVLVRMSSYAIRLQAINRRGGLSRGARDALAGLKAHCCDWTRIQTFQRDRFTRDRAIPELTFVNAGAAPRPILLTSLPCAVPCAQFKRAVRLFGGRDRSHLGYSVCRPASSSMVSRLPASSSDFQFSSLRLKYSTCRSFMNGFVFRRCIAIRQKKLPASYHSPSRSLIPVMKARLPTSLPWRASNAALADCHYTMLMFVGLRTKNSALKKVENKMKIPRYSKITLPQMTSRLR